MPYNDGNFLLCRGRFRGIAVPEDKADAFRGLYEVSIPDDMNMLMQFAHLDDRLPEALYQRIGLSPDPLFYYQSEKNAVDNLNLLEAARCFGRAEEARFIARAQLVLSRQPETRLFIAGRLLEDGSLEDALDREGGGVMLLADDPRVHDARGGVERVDGRVDTELGDAP